MDQRPKYKAWFKMDKRLWIHFCKDIKMANKHMKRYSTSLISGSANQKHRDYHLTPLGWLLSKINKWKKK